MEGIGRGDWIRTSDPLRPRQVRYQAALRPDYLDYNNALTATFGPLARLPLTESPIRGQRQLGPSLRGHVLHRIIETS
jgi:hypothetical protein